MSTTAKEVNEGLRAELDAQRPSASHAALIAELARERAKSAVLLEACQAAINGAEHDKACRFHENTSGGAVCDCFIARCLVAIEKAKG